MYHIVLHAFLFSVFANTLQHVHVSYMSVSTTWLYLCSAILVCQSHAQPQKCIYLLHFHSHSELGA